MSVRSFRSQLRKVEDALAAQRPPTPDPDQPSVPLFLRVACREALRRLDREGAGGGAGPPSWPAVFGVLPPGVLDRALEWTDLRSPNGWLDDGLGGVDQNQLSEGMVVVVRSSLSNKLARVEALLALQQPVQAEGGRRVEELLDLDLPLAVRQQILDAIGRLPEETTQGPLVALGQLDLPEALVEQISQAVQSGVWLADLPGDETSCQGAETVPAVEPTVEPILTPDVVAEAPPPAAVTTSATPSTSNGQPPVATEVPKACEPALPLAEHGDSRGESQSEIPKVAAPPLPLPPAPPSRGFCNVPEWYWRKL
jgi:hypothetical protein